MNNETIETVIQFRIDKSFSLISCENKLGYEKGDLVKVVKIIPEYIVKNGIRVFRVEVECKK